MARELELQHGIKLTIDGELGTGGFSVLAGYFAEARAHFEKMRDVAERPTNGDSFRRRFRTERGREVSIELSHPVPLEITLWVEAAESGYSSAERLEQVVAQFSGFRDFILIEKGDLIGSFKDSIDRDIQYASHVGDSRTGNSTSSDVREGQSGQLSGKISYRTAPNSKAMRDALESLRRGHGSPGRRGMHGPPARRVDPEWPG